MQHQAVGHTGADMHHDLEHRAPFGCKRSDVTRQHAGRSFHTRCRAAHIAHTWRQRVSDHQICGRAGPPVGDHDGVGQQSVGINWVDEVILVDGKFGQRRNRGCVAGLIICLYGIGRGRIDKDRGGVGEHCAGS